jgi:hypothetical protein
VSDWGCLDQRVNEGTATRLMYQECISCSVALCGMDFGGTPHLLFVGDCGCPGHGCLLPLDSPAPTEKHHYSPLAQLTTGVRWVSTAGSDSWVMELWSLDYVMAVG